MFENILTTETYENVMSIINPQELQAFCMYAYEELVEKQINLVIKKRPLCWA